MMLQVINRKPLIDGLSTEGLVLAARCRGEIVLRGVNFSYPARPELPICRGYDLHITPGETVALVGASGCGKVSLVIIVQIIGTSSARWRLQYSLRCCTYTPASGVRDLLSF